MSPSLVALYGGSFNPPHLAHVLAAATVLARFDVERFVVIPAFQHPFAKALVPFEDRAAMCRLAMAAMPKVEVSLVEQELGGESKTVRTIEHLVAKHPDWSGRLRFVMGADTLADSDKWYRFDRIKELAPPIVLGRVGVSFPGAPPPVLPEVSSTDVRARIAAGRWEAAGELVPRAVLEYIREKGLYSSTP